MKIFEYFVLLVSFSYFVGQLWYLFCEFEMEYLNDFNGKGAETFIEVY